MTIPEGIYDENDGAQSNINNSRGIFIMETIQPAVQKGRHFFIDNIRLFVIILVVIVHIVCIYADIGDFYYTENDSSSLDLFSTIFFAFFQMFSQGYFMGLLFLIAGFFVPGSYDKKGFYKFIKDRLVRLGIPTLIYTLAINPFIEYFLVGIHWKKVNSFFDYYSDYITSFQFIEETGPLWFAAALLIFSFIYACVRLVTSKSNMFNENELKTPETKQIIWLILLITICAFTIRQIYPFGTDVFNFKLCFFSQYVVFFIVGIVAYRNGWFMKFDYKSSLRWLKAALIPGALAWLALMLFGGAVEGKFDSLYTGGLHWQSAAYALWESFTGVSMSIGLITLFREKFNKQKNFTKALSDNAFAVYVFHPPIVIGITLAMKSIALPPAVKILMAALVILPACFVTTHYLVRRVPLLKKVV